MSRSVRSGERRFCLLLSLSLSVSGMSRNGWGGGFVDSRIDSRAMRDWDFEESSARVFSRVGRMEREREREEREVERVVVRWDWRVERRRDGWKVVVSAPVSGVYGERR